MEIEAIWINGIVLYGWSFDITSYDHHEIKYKIDRIRQTHWYGSGPPTVWLGACVRWPPKYNARFIYPAKVRYSRIWVRRPFALYDMIGLVI